MSETFRKGGPRKEVAAAERGSSTTVKPASAKLQNMGAFKGVVAVVRVLKAVSGHVEL